MQIASSLINNFKNINNKSFNWGPGINFISGPNGSGKTNLLEALNILTGWGTFGSRTRDCINWESDSQDQRAYLNSELKSNPNLAKGVDLELYQDLFANNNNYKVTAQLSTKISLKLDDKKISNTDLRLIIPSIAFQPQDINLIDGSPAVRRFFIDKLCALYFPPYAKRLAEFKQIARHRAALLRQNKSVNITDLPFANLGGWVMEARRIVSQELAKNFAGLFNNSNIKFCLMPELNNNLEGHSYLLNIIRDKNYIIRESAAMRVLVGPSHDDLKILFNGRDASVALSRGQKRRLVLYLIIASGYLISSRLRTRPVLLFDDLAAELDKNNLKICGEALLKTNWQIFVTGTEDLLPELDKNIYAMA